MEEISLINLPWEDILFSNVLPYFNLKELYMLRSVSRIYKLLIEQYFIVYYDINLAKYKKFDRKAFKVLRCCKSAKKVNFMKCNWLTDDILIQFLSNNSNIVDINLSFCNTISTKSMQILILNCRKLKCLKVSSCEWFATGAVDALTYHQYNLETVDFSKCILISERSILKFVVKFYRLKSLSIANIPSVSDNTVFTIANHCHDLETLNISGCNVSIEAISLLLKNCKKLELVKIVGRMLTRENLIMPYQ